MNPFHTLTTALLLAALAGCVLPSDEPPASNPPPQTPVYEFGDPYSLLLSDSLPRLQGDSLFVDIAYTGCGGEPFTLNHFVNGDTVEIWLHMTERTITCQAAIRETGRGFKVPDEVQNAASVQLVTPDLERIELIPAQAPVYNFGDGYALIQSDSLPRLDGDSLRVQLTDGCGGVGFTLEHFKTGNSSYEIWLNKIISLHCAIPWTGQRAFEVPDEIRDAQSVVLVTQTSERIELKD